MFAEIGLLVLEGDAAGLAAKVSELSAARREPPPARPASRCAGRPSGPTQRATPRPESNGAGPHDPARCACAPRTLPAFMTSLPLALSLSSTFTKIGAIAAFAALLGIAILSLLVFSQARELKRLREWAGRAPERAADMEQRVQLRGGRARSAAGARRQVGASGSAHGADPGARRQPPARRPRAVVGQPVGRAVGQPQGAAVRRRRAGATAPGAPPAPAPRGAAGAAPPLPAGRRHRR